MKKIFSLLLLSLVVISLSGCGNQMTDEEVEKLGNIINNP